MESDAAIVGDLAGRLGYWGAGFLIPMAVAYVLLRLAGSPKRSSPVGVLLRVLAVGCATLLTYASYSGGGGVINPGGVVAVVVVVMWAVMQQRRPKPI